MVCDDAVKRNLCTSFAVIKFHASLPPGPALFKYLITTQFLCQEKLSGPD